MYSYCTTPYFKGHKKTIQMVRVQYLCNAPIHNDGLKRVWISKKIMAAKDMVTSLWKNWCNFCIGGTRAIKLGVILHVLQTNNLVSPTKKRNECLSQGFFWNPIKSTTHSFHSSSSTETIKIFFITLVAIILYLDPYML